MKVSTHARQEIHKAMNPNTSYPQDMQDALDKCCEEADEIIQVWVKTLAERRPPERSEVNKETLDLATGKRAGSMIENAANGHNSVFLFM